VAQRGTQARLTSAEASDEEAATGDSGQPIEGPPVHRKTVTRRASVGTSAMFVLLGLWTASTPSAHAEIDPGSSSGSAAGSFSGSAHGSAQLPLPSPRAVAALGLAATQAGKPYQWGGVGPHAWDCSGLVQWAFRGVGIVLPRTTWKQAEAGLEVPVHALQVGDVIILNNDASHVGIYAGTGYVFNAYGVGVPVGLTPLESFDIYSIRRFF
jgi:peptidoglycan DL-endopeptidase CwlO